MTENKLDIQTISTKRTDFQADRVLLLGQVTEKKEKAHSSHFLKFLFAYPHCTHLVLPNTQADPSQNQKSAIFANAPDDKKISIINKLLKINVQYIAPSINKVTTFDALNNFTKKGDILNFATKQMLLDDMKLRLFILIYIATNFSFAQNILDNCNLSMSKSDLTIAIESKDIECICKSSESKFTLFFTFGSWCEPCILHLPNAINLSKLYDVTLYVLLIDNENTKREFDAVNYLKKLNENLNILIIKDFKNLKPKKKYINFLNDITPENFENINDMSKYILFNEKGEVLQITTWKDNKEYDWRDDTYMLEKKIIPIINNK